MILEIFKKEHCEEYTINHSFAVCNKALEIAKHFSNVDMELVKIGALLHDIGRCKTNSVFHGVEGAKLAKKYGYSDAVVNIIERHIGAGISEKEAIKIGLPKKSYIPKTLEEKIVAHSDNLINGTREVDINFVIDKWENKMENPKKNIKRLNELNQELVESFED